MIAILVIAAFGISVLLGMDWLAEVAANDDQDQAVTPEAGQSADRQRCAGERGAASAPRSADWLPFTPPAPAPLVLLSAPRICGGRLARVV